MSDPDTETAHEGSSAEIDQHELLTVSAFESSVDGYFVIECPTCTNHMHLGEMWRELILDDGHDIPECPHCNDGAGDQWSDDADVIMDGADFWAVAGEQIAEIDPFADNGSGSNV